MSEEVSNPAEVDVIVLGGGPGGYSCALRCADLGANVVLVEEREVGGTCLHRGCVPTRAMLHAAAFADDASRAERWGIDVSLNGIDMPALVSARDDLIDRNAAAVLRHLSRAGVEVVRGRGRVRGPRTVTVADRTLRARKAVVLAVGSSPHVPKGLDPDGVHILDSTGAMSLKHVPKSLAIVGGGAIGAEFSQLWRALGAEVILVEIGEHLVPLEDPDVGKELARSLRRRGIEVFTEAEITDATTGADSVEIVVSTPRGPEARSVEIVLLAAGRTPVTDDLDPSGLGLELDAGAIVPRDWATLETHAPGVFAIGDLLPPPSQARAHVAYAEGMMVAESILGAATRGIDYTGVPRVTHGMVETACVGLSSPAAEEAGMDVQVVRMPFGGVARGAMLGEGGMVKIVATRSGQIVGVHIVGPHAGELVGEAVALTDFEASLQEAGELIHAHPTLSEALFEGVLALGGRPLHHR